MGAYSLPPFLTGVSTVLNRVTLQSTEGGWSCLHLGEEAEARREEEQCAAMTSYVAELYLRLTQAVGSWVYNQDAVPAAYR